MQSPNLVYFSSVSENTHRFVEKLGVPATRIPLHGRIEVGEPLEADKEGPLRPEEPGEGIACMVPDAGARKSARRRGVDRLRCRGVDLRLSMGRPSLVEHPR